jgi:glycerol kinase
MQFQADILGIPIEVPEIAETTAVGAAYAGALGAGYIANLEWIRDRKSAVRRFEPKMGADEREALMYKWRRAVERAKRWAEDN